MPRRVFFPNWAVITQMTHSPPSKTLQNVKEMKPLGAIWCPNIAINNIPAGFRFFLRWTWSFTSAQGKHSSLLHETRLTRLSGGDDVWLISAHRRLSGWCLSSGSRASLFFVCHVGTWGRTRGVLVVGLTSGRSGRCTHEPSCCLTKSRKVHGEFFCCFLFCHSIVSHFVWVRQGRK